MPTRARIPAPCRCDPDSGQQKLRVDALVEIFYPAVVVFVNLAVPLLEIDARLVSDAVAGRRVGNLHHRGMRAQDQRAYELARSFFLDLPAQRRAGTNDREFDLVGAYRLPGRGHDDGFSDVQNG